MVTRGDRLKNDSLHWAKIGSGGLTDANGVKHRDDDGIDRVPDPPAELLPVLFVMKKHVQAYNLDLPSIFKEAGGSQFGTIPIHKFTSAIVVNFHRLEIPEEVLDLIADVYGTGSLSLGGGQRKEVKAKHDSAAWKDFCEDVNKAEDVAGISSSPDMPRPPQVRKYKCPSSCLTPRCRA